MSEPGDDRGVIRFAEKKVLELVDEGHYTATYKYAVLPALLDLCLESTKASNCVFMRPAEVAPLIREAVYSF